MKTNLLILMVILGLAVSPLKAESWFFLTRHGEKQLDQGRDPDLNEQGKLRAQNLAKQLAKAGITHIFSSNYKRTQQTAQPLADCLGLEIINYDPSELESFAKHLQALKGRVLIVGHSNTTPQLTSLISAKEVKALTEKDYGDLFLVRLSENKASLINLKSLP